MTVRPRVKATSDRKEGGIKNRLNWFVAKEMKGTGTGWGLGVGGWGVFALTEVCQAFGAVIMSHIFHALLFIADLARKQKINNFEQI